MMDKMVYAVGIGPGDPHYLTQAAREVLAQVDVVVGYRPYLEWIAPLIAGKEQLPGAMLGEVERCRAALDRAAAGERVAVVSSGDAGIYGMAGLLLELTELPCYADIEVVTEPGLTGAVACAALVGAPLMNDFAVVSLSDLMTPADVIRKRLAALAACDMTVALYNPASKKRRALLEFAVATFRAAGGDLPFAAVRDAYRAGQTVFTGRLSAFPFDEIQMTTLVIIGGSQTILRDGKLYCRRGYLEKYGAEIDR